MVAHNHSCYGCGAKGMSLDAFVRHHCVTTRSGKKSKTSKGFKNVSTGTCPGCFNRISKCSGKAKFCVKKK